MDTLTKGTYSCCVQMYCHVGNVHRFVMCAIIYRGGVICNSELAKVKDLVASHQKAVADLEEKKNSVVKGMQDEILALKEKCSKQDGENPQ